MQKTGTSLYRIRRPEGYVPPEDASPEDEYRPLPEVFERVVRSIQQAKAQEQEAEPASECSSMP